jgi:hypothetical protein
MLALLGLKRSLKESRAKKRSGANDDRQLARRLLNPGNMGNSDPTLARP